MILGDTISVDWKEGVLHPKPYIDAWRIALMDKAFVDVYIARGTHRFLKSTNVMNLAIGKKLAKRILYKYNLV